MNFNCAARSHVGCRRKLNEDSVLASGGPVWAVADGMGGHHAGEVASAMVVEALSRVGQGSSFDQLLAQALARLEDCNRELLAISHGEYEGRTIGSTVVGFVSVQGRLGCFWAGDSRAYRVRGGEIARLTRDHSMVQDLVDAGMLDESEAEGHPNANVITRAVGVHDQLHIDRVESEVAPGDIYLLASDGLTRLVSKDEILAELSGRSLEAAADALLQLTLGRGAPDNVSFALVAVP